MDKMHQLYEKYKEIILYIAFGLMTTVVNWGVYFPLYNFARMDIWLCNSIAWIISVLFAFITNKIYVFESKDWSAKITLPEFCKFVGCRVGSGVMELLLMVLTVDLMQLDGNWMKIAISVLVVIVNYIGSKLLFRHHKGQD